MGKTISKTWRAKDIAPGTRVLLRIDVNVPIIDGVVRRDGPLGRLAQALPEIRRLIKRRARVILVAHVGRPQGVDRTLSVAPLAKALGHALGVTIGVAKDVAGEFAKSMARALQPGEVIMLENVRFDSREEKNGRTFAKQLAALADVYVNNAFAACHRAHASVSAITAYLPSFAGELLLREVTELSRVRKQPLVLVVGGIKLETKVPLIKKLGREADRILLGSALYPALDAAKLPAGIVKKILPMIDVRKDARGRVIDIGPRTEHTFVSALQGAKTIVWNGPLGKTEVREGSSGTRVLARAIAESRARSIIGGGETVDVIENYGLTDDFYFISTGGGAMLAYLAGETLPGIDALRS